MQSELACHIGSMGKHFCRVCTVKGFDVSDDAPATPGEPEAQAGEVSGSEIGDDPDSPANSDTELFVASGAPKAKKSIRKKAAEGMENMVKRVKRFLKVSVYLQVILRNLIYLFRLEMLEQRTQQNIR
jgi:hypothetical protein